MGNNKTKGIPVLILFSLIPVIVLLAILEVGARLLPPVAYNPAATGFMGGGGALFREDPLLMWRARPNMKGRQSTNSGGFRDDEFSKKRKKNEVRVLLLGDSTTWGWGVAEKDMYAAVMESVLDNSGAGKDFNIIDGGMPGYSAFQGRLLLDTELGELQPDFVITYFGVNDSHARPGLTPDKDIKRAPVKLLGAVRLLRKSRFYNDMRKLADRARESAKAGESGSGVIKRRLSPEDFRTAMDGISADCDKIGATLISMNPVWFFNGRVRDDVSRILFTDKGTIVEYSGGNPVYSYEPAAWDTQKVLTQNPGIPPEALFLDYCHFSPYAHRMVGLSLAETVLAKIAVSKIK